MSVQVKAGSLEEEHTVGSGEPTKNYALSHFDPNHVFFFLFLLFFFKYLFIQNLEVTAFVRGKSDNTMRYHQ